MNMPPIVEVKGLTKIFNEHRVVDNLDFEINKGDIYGFLGQNGAGKSTTLRMLLGLVRKDSGLVKMFGYDHSQLQKILSKTGALIERPDLYKYLTAYEHLMMFARLSGLRPPKKQLMEQLEMVNLHSRYNSKVKTFSQGMKQRLGIAVSLIHNPDLLILDEPTNGLDPQGIAEMRSLLLNLSEHFGKTIIISSHLLSEIEQIANRMLIIHKGRKVVEGNVSELLDPTNTLVRVETTNINDVNQIKDKISQPEILYTIENGTICCRMNKDNVPQLIHQLSEAGVAITGVTARHSLEDYFINLTNPQ